MTRFWIWKWQAEAMGKFLLAASRAADHVRIEAEGETIVIRAYTEDEKVATLRVVGGHKPKITLEDEWGLMAELE